MHTYTAGETSYSRCPCCHATWGLYMYMFTPFVFVEGILVITGGGLHKLKAPIGSGFYISQWLKHKLSDDDRAINKDDSALSKKKKYMVGLSI